MYDRSAIFHRSTNVLQGAYSVGKLHETREIILPGQSRPVAFTIAAINAAEATLNIEARFFAVCFANRSAEIDGRDPMLIQVASKLPSRSIWHPHKIIFLHPAGVISYAILQCPSRRVVSTYDPKDKLPILLSLHGAGLEADDDGFKNSLASIHCWVPAWTLFPTGGSPWSGDDWHHWGWADVEAAVAAISAWIDLMSWSGPSVDESRWLVAGHSNGGQVSLSLKMPDPRKNYFCFRFPDSLRLKEEKINKLQ